MRRVMRGARATHEEPHHRGMQGAKAGFRRELAGKMQHDEAVARRPKELPEFFRIADKNALLDHPLHEAAHRPPGAPAGADQIGKPMLIGLREIEHQAVRLLVAQRKADVGFSDRTRLGDGIARTIRRLFHRIGEAVEGGGRGGQSSTPYDKVNRLVLYAPAWTFTTRPAIGGGEAPLGAYRTVSKDSARQRWLNGVPEAKKADLIPDGWFEQWADATWALDPAGERQTPPVLRAPNGVLQDFRTYWIAGKPQYDPADIRVPTLLIHAEWDADLPSDQARGYFAKLTNAPYKRYIEIGEGTHSIMMEKNRMQFFREIMNFLDERDPKQLN